MTPPSNSRSVQRMPARLNSAAAVALAVALAPAPAVSLATAWNRRARSPRVVNVAAGAVALAGEVALPAVALPVGAPPGRDTAGEGKAPVGKDRQLDRQGRSDGQTQRGQTDDTVRRQSGGR